MDNVEQIKSRINIVDLLREYIELKKAGANWKALCPFHSEKSPSFMVSEDKQIWHCFGCNEGGDIFGFIMKMENIDFPEALRILAKRAGVVLAHRAPMENSEKTKIMDILEAAAGFYSMELQKFAPAGEYLRKRELSAETIKQFRLGFSPLSWEGLLKFLQMKNIRAEDVARAGLAIARDGGGFFDRFRGRVMFPIFNHYGNIVGFTARVLPEYDDGKSGKYINTPETAAYKKSETVYGLNFAKNEIKKNGAAIIVEGNMDVIALHQAGFRNAIATSGTALTNEQLVLLKRYSDNLIVCFDADSAGIQAALRGIDLALQNGFNVKVFGMPRNESGEPVAKDPDELVKKFPELWKKAIAAPKHIIEFYIAANLAKYNLGDPHEAAHFAEAIMAEIGKIKNSMERGLWIKKLSEISGVDERDLREKTPGVFLRTRETGRGAPRASSPSRSANITDNIIEMKYLALVLGDILNSSVSVEMLSPEMFKDENAREFYKNLLFYYNNKQLDKTFESWLGRESRGGLFMEKILLFKDAEYADADEARLKTELRDLAAHIKSNYLKEQRKILEQEMAAAEKSGDKAKIKDILEKFKTLN